MKQSVKQLLLDFGSDSWMDKIRVPSLWRLTLCFCLLLSFLFYCSLDSQSVIPSKKLDIYNENLVKRTWTLQRNIYSPRGEKKKLLFVRNSKVKLYAETGADWVIVRAYSVRESIEKGQGKAILYLYPLRKKKFTLSDLDGAIYKLAR